MSKILLAGLVIVIVILLIVATVFLLAPNKKDITWGIDFSQAQAEFLKINWRQAYLDILHDLRVKNIKIITNWDFLEPKKDVFNFDDVDWQLARTQEAGANVIYVVGMKSGRWPECHMPTWANALSKEEQQKEILDYITTTVLRYKDNKTIVAWQAENEPLFNFGICPWYDKQFLQQEIQLIKSLDPTRQVIVSDSGEQSFWFEAAKFGDVVGITTYRKVWVSPIKNYGFFLTMPLPAKSYGLKAWIIKKVFNKKVINVELQAEPWVSDIYTEVSLQQQERTMSLEIFKDNVQYARNTGLDTFYFWGTEWWYWLKTTQNRPEIWNEAKKLFVQ